MAVPEEFCIVRTKKKRRYKQNAVCGAPYQSEENKPLDLDKFTKRLTDSMQDILLSDFFSETYDIVTGALSEIVQKRNETSGSCGSVKPESSSCSEKSELFDTTSQQVEDRLQTLVVSEEADVTIEIISYGLGNFLSCPIARYQLSLLLALRDKIQIGVPEIGFKARTIDCFVYDPVFTEQEKTFLEKRDCHVIEVNEEGKRECTPVTIAFLPHCGKALYNNLLWRNLVTPNSDGLHGLVLIGNSFSRMIESTPHRVLNKTGNFILQLNPHTKEVELPNTFVHKDVFNDLSVHWFPRPRLKDDLWNGLETSEEPVYSKEDVEFITNK